MPTLTRNETGINYKVAGKGPIILLTHGFGADHHMWSPQVEALKKTYTVVTWDMRGHGKSDSPADHSVYNENETVQDMAALLDAVGADDAIIGGMSLGGYMSLAFHNKYPERVKSLLLIDTGPGFKNDKARDDWNKVAVARGDEIDGSGMTSFQARAEAVAADHRDMRGVAMAARGMLVQNDGAVIHSLPDIAVPTLIVVGANDQPYLIPSDYMAAKIDNAVKVVIPNAGHASNLDQPEIFNKQLLGFLGET
jgi:pimeloyl-ACP methyl ester carboxylesterase